MDLITTTPNALPLLNRQRSIKLFLVPVDASFEKARPFRLISRKENARITLATGENLVDAFINFVARITTGMGDLLDGQSEVFTDLNDTLLADLCFSVRSSFSGMRIYCSFVSRLANERIEIYLPSLSTSSVISLIWASSTFSFATSTANHSARSTSGKSFEPPEANVIVKVLLVIAYASKSASDAHT